MTWEDVLRNAKINFNGTCKVCKVCDGVECKGKVPGMGGIGSGRSFIRNIIDLSDIQIKTKCIHDVKEPDIKINFLGVDLDIPVIAAPITGLTTNMGGLITEWDYAYSIIKGCKDNGSLGFVGDGSTSEKYKIGLNAVKDNDGFGGSIFKPRINQDDIKERIAEANKAGVKFIGIDIDAILFTTMNVSGQSTGPKTSDELKELISLSNAPFILKGIMSKHDANLAIDIGAKAIVISNHGGRIIDSHPSSISVLKEISDFVDGRIKIIFDGGIRTGEDIFKAIALGADVVMIGRPFSIAAMGGGVDGISLYIEQLKSQLKKIMLLTGTKDIGLINKNSVIRNN
jgi:isopentenyl diphosphate isomerase/L-lactate dehydrogenase-like FMN-dependent dehydrogenase